MHFFTILRIFFIADFFFRSFEVRRGGVRSFRSFQKASEVSIKSLLEIINKKGASLHLQPYRLLLIILMT